MGHPVLPPGIISGKYFQNTTKVLKKATTTLESQLEPPPLHTPSLSLSRSEEEDRVCLGGISCKRIQIVEGGVPDLALYSSCSTRERDNSLAYVLYTDENPPLPLQKHLTTMHQLDKFPNPYQRHCCDLDTS